VIYEINTWVWLGELSRRYGKAIDLATVPTKEWDALGSRGFDAVWFMGVWERSPAGIAISMRNAGLVEDFTRALPDFTPEDNVGSPYCVRRYVVDSALLSFRDAPTAGVSLIRPFPGFNPLKYASEYLPYARDPRQDPLVHYIRAGRPAGPWTHEVFEPHITTLQTNIIRAAIHGHFHYPELFPRFLENLSSNSISYDLFITTTSDENALELRTAASEYRRGKSEITVVPNRGRDIGPFILALSEGRFQSYDIVGHMHGKRSVDLDNADIAKRWRNFLWQNLIGGKRPSADAIAAKFIQDSSLGLVFPEDPHVIGWDDNREIAEALAKRMGLRTPLADYFDFPVGTMFWARPQALAPLASLGLSWEDLPGEPLPVDGTLLHALERLVPFVVDHSGFRMFVTAIPGVRR
jgi:hypothetical protein